ncbi:hypothetical protein [Brumimicrobium oceani]|uniref:Secretion system C-terminal sorting domain-containing protein n=1 Tax=Brumimicrobium oceani TaxID=2100725 RepID=A0A2U2XDJ4_9FLAO|nr:hypothetical protein [Brumimicrobium oceani]PWH85879.1 hypothetical protein DIT68_07230 [Brumimicrobium oceani]
MFVNVGFSVFSSRSLTIKATYWLVSIKNQIETHKIATSFLEELMYNITVYPNPASDFTSIKWEIYDELNNSHYKIFDLNGHEIQ